MRTIYARRLHLLTVVAFLILVSPVNAQQSSITAIASGSLGSMQAATARDLQYQILENRILEDAAPGRQGSASAVFPGVFAGGRLRYTEHDGYFSENSAHFDLGQFGVTEGSAFVSVYGNVPGVLAGGKVQVGAFAGGAFLDLDIKRFDPLLFAGPVDGSAENDSFLFGGYGLYSAGSDYAMLTMVGFLGETELKDEPDALDKPGTSTYDTWGLTASFLAGSVQSISKTVKIDLRGGVSYVRNEGDTFVDPVPQVLTPKFESGTVVGATTVFSVVPIEGGVLRPYAKGEVRYEFYYRNTVDNLYAGGTKFDHYEFGQDRTLGVAEAGFDYMLQGVTVSGAIYGELAGDREAIGGRLGAKFPLQ